MKTFIPEIEFAPLPQVRKFQAERMQETLAYLQARSPYYQRHFAQHHIDPSKIRRLEDLTYIPPTVKQDLQRCNWDFLAVPREDLVDYMTTSGTLGAPVVVAANQADLDRLAYNEAICFAGVGTRKGDLYQLMTTLDKRFMAGFAYCLGVQKLGAGICRVGNGLPEFQWATIELLRPNGIICVPSFLLKLIAYAQEHGIDYRNSSIRKAVCIGENLRKQDFSLSLLGQRIKEHWDIDLYSTYASTEMGTSFCECPAHKGGHLHPELIIAEVLDANDNPVLPGETGELTITNIGVQSMPLLRFKTGDICRFHYEPCACGRTVPRISPILGRHSQMIKLKGTTLYPPTVFDVLDQVPYVTDYVVELTDTDFGTDDLTVMVHTQLPPTETLEKDLKDRFRAHIRIAPKVQFHTQETIHKLQGLGVNRKITKFIDKRKTE